MRRRMTPGAATAGHDHGVNATPLIDVVMCLIIFFLLVGRIAHDRGAAVRLPESTRGYEEQAATILVVTVTALPPTPITAGAPSARNGGFAAIGVAVEVDGSAITNTGELENAVRGALAKDAQASVQLRADRELSFAAVEPVLKALGNAGAKSVRFATEKAG